MSEIILLSSNDYRNDSELKNLLTVPYTLLDAAHPSLTKEQRKRVLKEKYHKKLISDGLETGLLELNRNGELIYRSKQSESVFKGFVFEALLVCSGQVQPDTFLKEFSYSMGDWSPFDECNRSRL